MATGLLATSFTGYKHQADSLHKTRGSHKCNRGMHAVSQAAGRGAAPSNWCAWRVAFPVYIEMEPRAFETGGKGSGQAAEATSVAGCGEAAEQGQ
jgi:hypothetical protein